MFFGVVTATFSSIYIAGQVLLWVEHKWPRKRGDQTGPSPRSAKAAPQPTTPRTPVGAS